MGPGAVRARRPRSPRKAELGLLFDSANRDPEIFDEPDELRLDRQPDPHLTFGAEIHFCLGAPLGRMELQISFGTLLDRCPDLALAEEPRFRPNYVIRGLEGLRVTTGGATRPAIAGERSGSA